MLQLNSKNIPYQSVQVFLSLVSKSSDIANLNVQEKDEWIQKIQSKHFLIERQYTNPQRSRIYKIDDFLWRWLLRFHNILLQLQHQRYNGQNCNCKRQIISRRESYEIK